MKIDLKEVGTGMILRRTGTNGRLLWTW